MSIVDSGNDETGNVNRHIGTAYDSVKICADNIEDIKKAADLISAPGGSGFAEFSSVQEMKISPVFLDIDTLFTAGYYKKHGTGSAVYDVYTLEQYRIYIDYPEWVPDEFGDHTLADGRVAILRHGGYFWANQLGLPDPISDPIKAKLHFMDVSINFNNMYTYLQRQMDPSLSSDGRGKGGLINLHVNHGTYWTGHTTHFPAGVHLVGGDNYDAPGRNVKIKPYKPKHGGSISDYEPRIDQPRLDHHWVPNGIEVDPADDLAKRGYMKLTPEWTNDLSGFVDIYYEFEREKSRYADGLEYALFGHTTMATKAWTDAEKTRWDLTLEVNLANGSTQIVNFIPQPIKTLEGKMRLDIVDDGEFGVSIKWSTVGSEETKYFPPGTTLTLDMIGNDNGQARAWAQGKIQYITMFSDGGENTSNTYIEGIKYIQDGQVPTDLIMPSQIGSEGVLTDFPVGLEWRIEQEFDQNERNGFMFIWNGQKDNSGLGADQQVYLAPQMGGMSCVSLHNYEDNYNSEGIPRDYLKGINGCMVYGGAFFNNINAERIWTAFHKPQYETEDYYTDQWEIHNFKCNTPIENEVFQIDMNGLGDAVNIEGCQFPVNHPNEMDPTGEYPNGVVKAIKFQNSAFYTGNWKESTTGATAGSRISRIINGLVELHGCGHVTVANSHFEFGSLLFRDSSGSIDECYFSQISHVGRTVDEYFDIVTEDGQFAVGGRHLSIKGCDFHRGFDYAHCTNTRFNLIASESHNISIENCYQGWNLAGGGPVQVAMTVGVKKEDKTDPENTVVTYEPLDGWERWSHFLTSKCEIVRGKIKPQVVEREVGGFGGLEDAFILKTDVPEYWMDVDTGVTGPSGIHLYYDVQLLWDPLDKYHTFSDTPEGTLPLGMNPFIGFELDGITLLPTERSVYVPPAGDTSWNRPAFGMYNQQRTISDGIMRLYRGTESGVYTHYVDIPSPGIITLEDTWGEVYGHKWKVNPNANGAKFPINDQIRQGRKHWKFHIRGGSGYTSIPDEGAPTFLSNGWHEEIFAWGKGGTSGGLERNDIVLTAAKNFGASELDFKDTMAVVRDGTVGNLYFNLDTAGYPDAKFTITNQKTPTGIGNDYVYLGSYGGGTLTNVAVAPGATVAVRRFKDALAIVDDWLVV